jgi:hypothetical protein
MRILLILLFVNLPARAYEIPAHLKGGDLIFLSLDCYACKLIEATTHSPYSHVGTIDREETGDLMVIMAVSPRVTRVPLRWLVSKALGQPLFMRIRDPQKLGWAERALEIARRYLGRPYDPDFILGDEKLYCSELIYFSFNGATQNPEIPFRLKVMHFAPFTTKWAEVLGHPPPEGQMGVSPGDLTASPYFEKILLL